MQNREIYVGFLLPENVFYLKTLKINWNFYFEAMPIKWINQSAQMGRGPPEA